MCVRVCACVRAWAVTADLYMYVYVVHRYYFAYFSSQMLLQHDFVHEPIKLLADKYLLYIAKGTLQMIYLQSSNSKTLV